MCADQRSRSTRAIGSPKHTQKDLLGPKDHARCDCDVSYHKIASRQYRGVGQYITTCNKAETDGSYGYKYIYFEFRKKEFFNVNSSFR